MSLDDLLPDDGVLPEVIPRGEYLLTDGRLYEWVDKLTESGGRLMYSTGLVLRYERVIMKPFSGGNSYGND